MPQKYINLREVQTYPLSERKNLVKLNDLILPGQIANPYESHELSQVANYIIKARQESNPVIWMMGAHVIKSGLGLIMIDLMKRGFITHIAGNGAVGIHDFELALIGETSEDVATSIEDGTFGMAEETGALIHQALRSGSMDRLGYGESLGRFITNHEFPHREVSVLYQAYQLNIPFTIHVTLGADIIHQHPDCDFGILGAASGHDFKIFCHSVSKLDHGVFLNFGSAVTGPEVFLKALSIARNLGHKVEGFTTANFDILPLPADYHNPTSPDSPVYYYRPLKNIINRPTSLNGQGFHVQGDHRLTIPTLHHHITVQTNASERSTAQTKQQIKPEGLSDFITLVSERSLMAAKACKNLLNRKPELSAAIPALCRAYFAIAESFERGGTLFLCGNGGSMADAQHIAGELQKSFLLKRPLNKASAHRLNGFDPDKILSKHLEAGLTAYVLGLNPALNSAIDNDFGHRWLNIAQELQAMAKTGDVFLGISTSGRAKNILYANYTARSMGCQVILLTGEQESALSNFADIAIHAPGSATHLIQEAHISLYHCLCAMLERDFFGDPAEI
jgi:phosphoheptose isomerase